MGTGPHSPPGYEILEKLGEGAMASVYRARHKALGRVVALKVLRAREEGGTRAEQDYISRFRREARLAARLNHPHILQVFDVGHWGDSYYLALEYVRGESLAARMTREGRVGEVQAIRIARDVAKALAHAAQHGVVHRDVKPSNILLTSSGSAKLGDFGVARDARHKDTTLTANGMTVGTPNYMSPEQARGRRNLDVRSDIYSLGATLFQAVTGALPYEGTTGFEVLRKHAQEPLPPPKSVDPALSDELCAIIERMMKKEPAQRYQTAEELIADLNRAEPRVRTRATVQRPRSMLSRVASWMAVLLTVAAVGGAGLLVYRSAVASPAPRNTRPRPRSKPSVGPAVPRPSSGTPQHVSRNEPAVRPAHTAPAPSRQDPLPAVPRPTEPVTPAARPKPRARTGPAVVDTLHAFPFHAQQGHSLLRAAVKRCAGAVALAKDPLSPENLARAPLLIVLIPGRRLGPDASKTIEAYVRSGGALLVVGGKPLTDAAMLGMRVVPDTAATPGRGSAILTTFMPHPITRGLRKVAYDSGLRLEAAPPARVLALRAASSAAPRGTAAAAIMAAAEVDMGRAAYLAGNLIFGNNFTRRPDLDNARLMGNVLQWLLRKDKGNDRSRETPGGTPPRRE